MSVLGLGQEREREGGRRWLAAGQERKRRRAAAGQEREGRGGPNPKNQDPGVQTLFLTQQLLAMLVKIRKPQGYAKVTVLVC